MRDICRWHVEEFAYLLARLKSIPEGSGTLLDHTCALFIHEHAECNSHKNAGLAMIACGLFGLEGLAIGYLIAAVGTVTLLTGFVGFCPMCAMGGRRLGTKK
jgi:hypothetical protein